MSNFFLDTVKSDDGCKKIVGNLCGNVKDYDKIMSPIKMTKPK